LLVSHVDLRFGFASAPGFQLLLQLLALYADHQVECVFVLEFQLLSKSHVWLDLLHVLSVPVQETQLLLKPPFFLQLMYFFPKRFPFSLALRNIFI
jgi:hypothetical protein